MTVAAASPAPSQRRVRTPTVIQMETVECGAAALAIVLGYYGRYVSLEELRAACGVSRDGSKASNVVRAARTYGLTAGGQRLEPHEVQSVRLPVIVYWNFNHFVVVEGYAHGRWYLNDPAEGPRVVTEQEFDESFTGVALVMEPGPEFAPGGQRPRLLPALRRRLGDSHWAIAYVVLAGLALVIPGLAVPVFVKVFVDQVLVGGAAHWLGPLLALMALTAAVLAGLTWLQQYYLLRLETRLALQTSSIFFWHVLRLPVQFFAQRFGGELGSRVAINDRVAWLLSGELATAALNVVLVGFFVVVMLSYDVVLTLIGVLSAIVNFAVLRYVARRRTDGNKRLLQERGKLLGTSMGGLQTVETLKACGRESDFFSHWAGYQAKTVNAEQELGVQSQLLTVVPPLLAALTTAAILGVGGLEVIAGTLSMGTLVAFQLLMTRFQDPINQFVALGGSLQEVEGDMNRLDDILGHPIDPRLAASVGVGGPAAAPTLLAGELELRHVTFGYSRLEPPLLDDFNLHLRPGARVALVGGSRSGKSTVAKLVAGLYEPWSGEVLFDGQPRSAHAPGTLASSRAMVDQTTFLFEGTVRQNLTLWDATVPEADVVQAARDASIHAAVVARPGGYESAVREGGTNFSGGEAQRLEIARALVGNPRLLILDEATSALDPATEQLIDDHLRRRGCTCLIVAKRLSTIRDCDEIIVLEGGKVVQRGTHQQLADQDGPYASLIATE